MGKVWFTHRPYNPKVAGDSWGCTAKSKDSRAQKDDYFPRSNFAQISGLSHLSLAMQQDQGDTLESQKASTWGLNKMSVQLNETSPETPITARTDNSWPCFEDSWLIAHTPGGQQSLLERPPVTFLAVLPFPSTLCPQKQSHYRQRLL